MKATATRDCATLRVLGIDPAAAGATGYGVVELKAGCCRMLRFGALRRSNGTPADFPARLREIYSTVVRLIEEFTPHAVAVESVFTALNMKTALRLAEVRGVVLLAAAEAGLPVHSYSPREVKQKIAGYGHADKHQMQQMVRAMLRMSETPEPADAADALAVALCHIYAEQTRARIAAATAPRPHTPRSRAAAARISSLR